MVARETNKFSADATVTIHPPNISEIDFDHFHTCSMVGTLLCPPMMASHR